MIRAAYSRSASMPARSTYRRPADIVQIAISELLGTRRAVAEVKQARLAIEATTIGPSVFYVGDISLARAPSVAIVGSRKVSEAGARRARKLACALAQHHVVVISGLAEGVDFNAHWAAIEAGGRTVGVTGTPLDKAYPAKHADLQEKIYREHLLVSPFRVGSVVHRSNFPQRNKLMAAMSDATVIIEASDTSGALHQASECAQLGRWLFIAKSLTEPGGPEWPKKFLNGSKARVLEDVKDLLEVLI